MASIRKITLKKGNPDGTIELSGKKTAWKKDFINWEIKTGSGISSIEKIVKKSGSPEIFRDLPHSNGSDWSAEVMHDVAEDTVYQYAILWKDSDGNPQTFDPIITIRPRVFSDLTLLAPIATFAFGLLVSFLVWRQERMKLKRQIETLERNKLK